MCGVAQLSPGAYFLRRDLFSSITNVRVNIRIVNSNSPLIMIPVQFILSPDTEQYTFEAILLLAVLANFHKSDAAKLNPYLLKMKRTQDKELMRKICWASNFGLDAAVK